MPDTSRDPVDHARTTRQHAGETMKAGVNAPGMIALGVGIVSLAVGLSSFANGVGAVGVAAVVLAVLLIGGGLGGLMLAHRKVQRAQVDWHRSNPEAHYEPPTS